MVQSATILQELNELNSTLASARTEDPVYAVPEGYFEGLASNILQRIKAEEASTPQKELEYLSPLLAEISGKNPYTVPEGYFEELNPAFAYIEEQDSKSELQQLSPLLSGLTKKTPFSVPEDYFTKEINIPDTKQLRPAPVVRMAAPKKWYRFAAAASAIAVIGLSITLWMRQPSVTPSEGQTYAWIEKNLKKVSTEDISEFVELAEPAVGDMAIASVPGDIKNLMKNVSDKEIQDFLKDLPLDETDDEDILF